MYQWKINEEQRLRLQVRNSLYKDSGEDLCASSAGSTGADTSCAGAFVCIERSWNERRAHQTP